MSAKINMDSLKKTVVTASAEPTSSQSAQVADGLKSGPSRCSASSQLSYGCGVTGVLVISRYTKTKLHPAQASRIGDVCLYGV